MYIADLQGQFLWLFVRIWLLASIFEGNELSSLSISPFKSALHIFFLSCFDLCFHKTLGLYIRNRSAMDKSIVCIA